jgi:hypothetical protein
MLHYLNIFYVVSAPLHRVQEGMKQIKPEVLMKNALEASWAICHVDTEYFCILERFLCPS